MILKGRYNIAKVFTDNVEEECVNQITQLLNQEAFADSKIRIMPDCHSGIGCVIGFTGDLGEKIIPNIVGVDIGCGMYCVELGNVDLNLEQIDHIINEYIPNGPNTHENKMVEFKALLELHCYKELKDINRIECSIGTLGGGNHFIEINVDDKNNKYLVIHSGSRNLGKQVAEYYQKLAIDLLSGKEELPIKQKELIQLYKQQGRENEIQNAIKELHKHFNAITPSIPDELCYLTGKYREMYIHDMNICQQYAKLNRKTIADIILEKANLQAVNTFTTMHNYIDLKNNIIRKGAISAYKDEVVIIPLNMRDGSLICIGKGNADWNHSAPHGAGRLLSRSKAKATISLEAFKESMKDVYSTSICENTIDESPMAYKSMEEIILYIKDTVEIITAIKPLYNFKAH